MVADKVYSTASPYFDDESIQKIQSDIKETLKSGILTRGPKTLEFEKKFAEYLKVKYAVAVNSGTSNLEMALRYFGVKDREVIVPTNTFIATPNSVIFAGGRPVFADMNEDSLCLDVDDVKRRITPKTAGIIVVHMAGLVCPEIDELSKLCKDNDLFLLEDCAHAHGASINNRMTGTLSDAGCFSFYPTKVMTTGEGGMLVTDNEDLANAARLMRNHGQDSQELMVKLGHNWCMSEISAILGIHQLEQLESFVRRRNEIASRYETLLKDVKGVSLFKVPQKIRHSYYKYPLKLDESVDLNGVASLMKNQFGISTGRSYYPPCHLHPYYAENFGTKLGDYPVAENVLRRVLCLPMHVSLADEHVQYISDALSFSIKAMEM